MSTRFFEYSCLYPHVDLALFEDTICLKGLEEKALVANTSPQKIVNELLKARILFIHPDGFDTWSDRLLQMATKMDLPTKLIIIGGSDLCLGDEHMEAMVAFFPHTEFWIQNWCGRSERCVLLPLGVNGQCVETLEKSKALGISYMLNYINTDFTEKRAEFFDFLEQHPTLKEYCLTKSDFKEYCKSLSACYLSACPMGNGFDTLRFWESLMVGAIPVVKDHSFYDDIVYHYPRLPILRVKEWDELLFLVNHADEVHSELVANADIDCLKEAFWIDRLLAKNKN
jgi:hypothetical protein